MDLSTFFGTGNVHSGTGSEVALAINSSNDQWIAVRVTGGLNQVFAQESGGTYVSSFNTAEDLLTALILKGKEVTEATTSDSRSFQITGATSNPQTDISFRLGATLSRWNYTANVYTPYTGLTKPRASEL